ncbi:MAG: hypothetical protein AAGD15_01560 [Agrobacterium cavarae]|uniref:hypothetical protein n=1 Tax=Agrobacterium cavarae TaxID=2528239 RepID=UPI0031A788F9
MQSEELKRKSMAFDDMSPDESIGAFGGSGQWVELCTVRDLREFEAALSTDAEPVRWMIEETLHGGSICWKVVEHELHARIEAEEMARKSGNPVNVRPLYDRPQQTAPSVAVKALRNLVEDLEMRAVDGVVNCSHGVYCEALSALSAQVQDVAGWQPIETAPKDGTQILAYPCFGGKDPYQVRWRQTKRGGWEHWTHLVPLSPTHWMPLPASPAPKHGEEG